MVNVREAYGPSNWQLNARANMSKVNYADSTRHSPAKMARTLSSRAVEALSISSGIYDLSPPR